MVGAAIHLVLNLLLFVSDDGYVYFPAFIDTKVLMLLKPSLIIIIFLCNKAKHFVPLILVVCMVRLKHFHSWALKQKVMVMKPAFCTIMNCTKTI